MLNKKAIGLVCTLTVSVNKNQNNAAFNNNPYISFFSARECIHLESIGGGHEGITTCYEYKLGSLQTT